MMKWPLIAARDLPNQLATLDFSLDLKYTGTFIMNIEDSIILHHHNFDYRCE